LLSSTTDHNLFSEKMSGSEMSGLDGEDKKNKDNVVRLGTEALFAIAEELRQMYEADLRSKPSERLERLMRKIENGDGAALEPEPPG
jgi:hypothetical protein